MRNESQEILTFHRTGRSPSDRVQGFAEQQLRPALLANYSDLTAIRHDFPLVLADRGSQQAVRSLTAVIDAALQKTAPRGIAGERMRKDILNLELEIKKLVAGEAEGTLSQMWKLASENVVSNGGMSPKDAETFRRNADAAKRALSCDGELVGCDDKTPVKVLKHAWNTIQDEASRRVLSALNDIVIKLSDILKADDLKSEQGRRPEFLKASVGTSFEGEFDFGVMSDMMAQSSREALLPDKRRKRIAFALSVLQSQRFFVSRGDNGRAENLTLRESFAVDNCAEALDKFRARLPEMVNFVKALRIAELEIANQYREDKHDAFFEEFGEESLAADEIGLFPSYLICLDDGTCSDTDRAKLFEILSSDLPIKVLYVSRTLYGDAGLNNGRPSLGAWNLRLGAVATGLSKAYVVQSTTSNLCQVAENISEGLKYRGPALFSVFAAEPHGPTALAPYLMSAAAMECRAFPAFVFDPGQGDVWASRFQLAGNPQQERTWAEHTLCYEDADLQQIEPPLAFTFVDFLAIDSRFASEFLRVPQGGTADEMIPVQEYLELDAAAAQKKVPCIVMVDQDHALQKVAVGSGAIRAARSIAEMWRGLQELGGIDNSHALRLLDSQKKVWEEEKQKEIEELRQQLGKAGAEAAVETEAAVVGEPKPAEKAEAKEEEKPPGDEPYIETPRCTSCDECINKNKRMFAYNENKQAYIVDPKAGSYRDMVEAAEACKVAIIHPGKPWNPDEPNLDDLTKRAEAFIS